MPNEKWCGRCQHEYELKWDYCPECGPIELKAAKHLTEIRNLIMFVLVLQVVIFLAPFAGIRL